MKLISVDNLKIFFNNQLSKRGLSEQNSKNITNALIKLMHLKLCQIM